MKKDFDKWNILKKRIHDEKNEKLYHEREIWWCSLGLNIGIEIDGKNEKFERTALILKKFNRDMMWAIPITSSTKNDKFHYKFSFNNKEYFVALTQIKTISMKRLIRKVGMVPIKEFNEIIKKIIGFFPDENPLLAGFLGGRSHNHL